MNRGWQNMDVRSVESYINGNKGSVIMFDLNVGNLLSFTVAFVRTKHTGKKISTGIVFYCTKWVRTQSNAEHVQYRRTQNESERRKLQWYVYLLYCLWELSGVVPVLYNCRPVVKSKLSTLSVLELTIGHDPVPVHSTYFLCRVYPCALF
jgi:hypothetical protein